MPIVKPGAEKPALIPLPIEAASGPKRDAALEFMRRCPLATDAEVKKVCSYNLKAVSEIRARMNPKETKAIDRSRTVVTVSHAQENS